VILIHGIQFGSLSKLMETARKIVIVVLFIGTVVLMNCSRELAEDFA